jgi:hypothetical protein
MWINRVTLLNLLLLSNSIPQHGTEIVPCFSIFLFPFFDNNQHLFILFFKYPDRVMKRNARNQIIHNLKKSLKM